MFHRPHNRGFTLPELMISVSIIMIIFAFSGINLLRIIPESSLTEVSGSFMADAKSQQQSAMLGESPGSLQIDYSIKIDETSYTLFRGSTFDPNDPSNYTVAYPENVTADTNFSGDKITFSSITGDIKDYSAVGNRVVFTGLYDKHLTIMFNKIGNVYFINRI